jgi:hypothetical protein
MSSIPPTTQEAIAKELSRLSGTFWHVGFRTPEPARTAPWRSLLQQEFDQRQYEFDLVSSDHHAIRVTTQWDDQLRLVFRAIEPERPNTISYRDIQDNYEFPSITVAKDRFAEHIAKDVNRRLIPKANQAWERWHARVQTVLSRRQVASTNLTRLNQLLPQATMRSMGDEHRMSWVHDGIQAQVDVYEYSQTVDVSLSGLSVEVAAAVLKMVAATTRPNSATTNR